MFSKGSMVLFLVCVWGGAWSSGEDETWRYSSHLSAAIRGSDTIVHQMVASICFADRKHLGLIALFI